MSILTDLLSKPGEHLRYTLETGRFAKQTRRPFTPGKLRTDSVLFALVVIFTALIVVGLTSFSVLALGPIIEQLRMG